MPINKVIYNGNTLIDLTGDTVSSAEHIVSGYSGHLRDGSVVEGTGGGATPTGKIDLNSEGEHNVTNYATANYIYLFPVRAYINVSSKYWAYYTDASVSFMLPVVTGKTYTLKWADTESGMYRIAFIKQETFPTSTSTAQRKTTYKHDGTSGVELDSQIATYREFSFSITDSSLKTCVVQIPGSNDLWSGQIRWFVEKMKNLTITVTDSQ